MTVRPPNFQSLREKAEWAVTFSVCCIVTRWEEYNSARAAFSGQNFCSANTEFLVCDNSASNRFDAYQAVRMFLSQARGRYIVIAHQDSHPLAPCSDLLEKLVLLERVDPLWGIAGNAGIADHSWPAAIGSLTMPKGAQLRMESTHQKVLSLDENVLIVRNGYGVTLSADLQGYHLYGLDMCLIAKRIGLTSYVIDYPWYHNSHGTIAKDFFLSKAAFESKMSNCVEFTSCPTTCTYVCWSSSKWRQAYCLACSFLQLAFSSEQEEGRRLLWRKGCRNLLFMPAVLLALLVLFVPRFLANKLYRGAQKLGLTKCKI